jgi:hypothetical protein
VPATIFRPEPDAFEYLIGLRRLSGANRGAYRGREGFDIFGSGDGASPLSLTVAGISPHSVPCGNYAYVRPFTIR